MEQKPQYVTITIPVANIRTVKNHVVRLLVDMHPDETLNSLAQRFKHYMYSSNNIHVPSIHEYLHITNVRVNLHSDYDSIVSTCLKAVAQEINKDQRYSYMMSQSDLGNRYGMTRHSVQRLLALL